MIGRIWHGWTTPDNADAYETNYANASRTRRF
jgi:hypothetical protein